MPYSYDYREAACAAIDTAYPLTAQGANTPGAFVVPAGCSRITEIRIGLAGISSDTVAQIVSYINLKDVSKSPWFAGPIAGTAGAAVTSGGYSIGKLMKYKTNIPVTTGQNINVDAYVSGTDSGTAHVLVGLGFDGAPGHIVNADIREGDLTAANTLVACQNRGGVAAGNFKPTGAITEIIFGVAPTPTGHATDGLIAACALHLTGIPGSGVQNYLGNAGFMEPDTDVHGPGIVQELPERYEIPGGLATVNEITASAQMIESTQAGNAIVCLCYNR